MSQLFLAAELEPAPVPPSESDEFYTPAHIFDPLHQELGFTLDVCATAESAKLPRFYTQVQDGLRSTWVGERVWCNPPYSDIAPWVRKADEAVRSWHTEMVAMLLPATKTEQPWWQDYVEPFRDGRSAKVSLEARFMRRRIAFGYPGNPTGKGAGTGTFGCVLLVWRAVR